MIWPLSLSMVYFWFLGTFGYRSGLKLPSVKAPDISNHMQKTVWLYLKSVARKMVLKNYLIHYYLTL